jgi:diadenosine tetraphosphate (Ap4A) HIT family hydrolase
MSCCFLCSPNEKLVFLSNDLFFAMLGYGPIVEGYSLIATREHIPSMLDLDRGVAEALVDFSKRVRDRLSSHYGNVIITEHGRVGLCARGRHEQHCYHAHRLVFPLACELVQDLRDHNMSSRAYPNFLAVHDEYRHAGEYLYFERSDESCAIAPTSKGLARHA